jgi:hypothetical protein
MAWNGSGVFSRTNGVHTGSTTWVQDRDAGAYILATRHDTHDEDLATGINACLTKNNETKPTADFCPNADATYDLGSASLRWAEARINKTIWETSFFAGIVSSNPRIDFDSGNDAIIYNRSSNQLEGYIGGVQSWVDNAAGRFGVNGTAGAPAYSFISDPDSGLFRVQANELGIALGGVKYFNFATTGIGVTGTDSTIPMPAFSATPVTMTAGYTNNTIEVSKDAHGVVWVKGNGNKDSGASGALTYFTLASGYRPDQTAIKTVRNDTDGAVKCVINTDGTVVVTHASSNNANTYFDFAFPTT